MSRPAASLLLLPFLAAPVAGQAGTAARAGTLGLDDPPFPLPLSRPAVSGDADHAVVAVNSRGDVCVAWHTVRLDLGGNPAQVEAAIDFVEEDLDVLDAPRLGEQATALAQELAALAATSRRGRLLREGARLSLAGPPNAGKSSLFNALCGHDRAIVTPHAGTTRDVLEETIDVRGVPAVLADTAGLRDTADPVESVGVDRARRHVEASDLVIYLHDGATEPGESSALAFETPPGVPVVEVTSKVDLPHAHVRPGTLGVSVVTGEGLDELLDRVARDLGVLDGDSGLVVTRERHRAALDEAARALHAAAEGLSHQAPLELVALDLRESLEALGTLVGETTPEDVLGEIFSTFCVGK